MEASNFISFSFLLFFLSFLFFFLFCFVFLFVKKNCPVLSCFINFIFNSFIIRYWMYFVVIERKKKLKKTLQELEKLDNHTT